MKKRCKESEGGREKLRVYNKSQTDLDVLHDRAGTDASESDAVDLVVGRDLGAT